MARNPREFEDLLKLPPEERLRLANWLIDSATNGSRGGSGSDSPVQFQTKTARGPGLYSGR
jgi:hypothetical protein